MDPAIVQYAAQGQLRRERVFRDRENPLEVLTDQQVKSRFRLPRQVIFMLVGMLQATLQRPTKRSCSLPVMLQVLSALRFYACGAYQLVVGDTIKLSKSSVSRCVHRVTDALCTHLNRVVLFPNQLDAVKQQFYDIAGFPNVVGAIDCTHIRIKAPTGQDEPDFLNRKGFHSINVQIVCTAGFFVTNVVAKWPGSVHDARIFRGSALARALEQGQLQGCLIGDSGYPCRNFLMTPFLNADSVAKRNYNKALCKTRVVIEQTNGILKMRWGCLQWLRLTPSRAIRTICACIILHNLAITNGDHLQNLDEYPVEDDQPAVHLQQAMPDGARARQLIVDNYFL